MPKGKAKIASSVKSTTKGRPSLEEATLPAAGANASQVAGIAIWIPAGLLMAALVTRLLASMNDFWLDEIWSYDFARAIHSPLDVFTVLKHDNNHHLNTLLMYLLGDHMDNWLIYRIPSVIAGTAAVAIAGLIGQLRGKAEAIFAMILTAFSFLLIQYSSEARGYSLAVFFCLLAFYVAQLYLRRPTAALGVAFFGSIVLAMLSHLTSIHFYMGCGLWTTVQMLRTGPSLGRSLRNIALLHAAPALFILVFFWFCVRGMEIGGWVEYTYWGVISSTLGLTLGAPQWRDTTLIAAAVVTAMLGLGLYLTWRDRSRMWLMFVGCMIVSPAASFVLFKPLALFERYFIVCVAMGLVLMSFSLGFLWRKNLGGKLVCGLLLLAFIGGNAFHTQWLIRAGRGNYRDAVAFVAEHSTSEPIYIRSDSSLRSTILLSFYCRYLQVPRQFIYLSEKQTCSQPIEWVLFHRMRVTDEQPPRLREVGTDARYELVLTSDMFTPDHPSALSGWGWDLYHNRAMPMR